jgi:hypothetical protein
MRQILDQKNILCGYSTPGEKISTFLTSFDAFDELKRNETLKGAELVKMKIINFLILFRLILFLCAFKLVSNRFHYVLIR